MWKEYRRSRLTDETNRFTIDSFSFYSFFLRVAHVLLAFQRGPRTNAFVTIRSSSSSSSSPSWRHFHLRQPSRRISRMRSLSLRITGPRFSLFFFSICSSFHLPFVFSRWDDRPRAPCPGPRDIHYDQSALQIVVLSDTTILPSGIPSVLECVASQIIVRTQRDHIV